MRKKHVLVLIPVLLAFLMSVALRAGSLEKAFLKPPDSARPWVYWYFMDGNLSKEGMTADLESMRRAGIGGGIFLEVNIGIPRGPVDFMSPKWQELFRHAVKEADRLGLELALGSGPGWCGTGGPWVKPEQSMQHLVASETNVTGPTRFDAPLARPAPRKPFFSEATLTPELAKQWRDFYRDVVVLAFPTPAAKDRIADIDEQALYYRAPFSSQPGVKPFLPAPAGCEDTPPELCLTASQVLDLTAELQPGGRLTWDVPAGEWTILRLGRTITGQTTRPAPAPGLGFETDKFDRAALDSHFDAYVERLLRTVGNVSHKGRGLTTLHFDSWEMSSQNWSANFRVEFRKRRGYDLLPFLPVMTGRLVDSREVSERFLWDLRQTAQELVVENHVAHLKELGRRHGLQFSIEPYDMNPCADLELGKVADVPQCEFWAQGYGFATEYSCIEAVSLGHTLGRPVVAAEAFTAEPGEDWKLYPGAMKGQADWALCCGINRIIFHRYQHQPWLDRWPGMTMGPYGVHWERTQTWWDMSSAFHIYLARCQQMLRRGLPVADILYLAPEGAPMVFRPPASATTGKLPDRRGYNFDGCAPSVLLERASVRGGQIVFPDGMSYRLLVLPEVETMTPGLLRKVLELVKAGAWVVGAPPCKSPSLSGYPDCDHAVARLSQELWGSGTEGERVVGEGRVTMDVEAKQLRTTANSAAAPEKSAAGASPDLYPSYDFTAQLLARDGTAPDFESEGSVRYIHRREGKVDFYYVASRESMEQSVRCAFRVTGRQPEWWSPVTGERRILPDYRVKDGVTTIPLQFAPLESAFIVFRSPAKRARATGLNFQSVEDLLTVSGEWEVAFDPKWGGPAKTVFAQLGDWGTNSEPGIRYYSGKASYRMTFALNDSVLRRGQGLYFLALGEVKDLASVRLNGQELGIVWCSPWRVQVPRKLLRIGNNDLEITVANLWPNRLIGDQIVPASQRLCWTTRNPFKADSPLLPSGLLGPVTLQRESTGRVVGL